MIAIGNFRYLQTGALSFLTITCKMKSQKHASRFDLRYDTYSGLWCHKPMKELGFECDFVKVVLIALRHAVSQLEREAPDDGQLPRQALPQRQQRGISRSTA